jgi:hypothetical protein
MRRYDRPATRAYPNLYDLWTRGFFLALRYLATGCLILTVRPAACVFKLAPGGPSVLETTLSPGTRLEIDATDVAVATTVAVGRSCMQEVQGDSQTGP